MAHPRGFEPLTFAFGGLGLIKFNNIYNSLDEIFFIRL